MATPAQMEANRANALKSTGPRTAEGKDASRRNALKHGLAAETLVLPGEEAAAVAARVAAWSPALAPKGEYDAWLVGEIALNSVRIDRCRAHENALRTRQADRAALCWDDDREAEAEELARRLSKSPSLVSCKLRATKQGCAWLIARWEGLLAALEAKGGWDEPQKRLAMDLLGTPPELRLVGLPIEGGVDALHSLARAQVKALDARRSGPLDELDALERSATEAGLGPKTDKAVALARRYEAASVRRIEWARKQIGKMRPAVSTPRAVPTPPPVEVARPALAPLPAPETQIPPKPLATASTPFATIPTPALGNRRSRRARRALERRA